MSDKVVKEGVMELSSAAEIDIIHDHQQKQLRDIIESYRILPNSCTFSQLDEAIQEDIKTHCRNYKPVCPLGNRYHNCTFRYIDNASISKVLQPRYECKTCNRTFTLFGRSYMGVANKRSLVESEDDQKCRSNRKKIKKTKELVAACYTASDHDEELIIVEPHTQKTTSTRCITGLASCSCRQNQLYASQSQWPLDVQRLPVQRHNILGSTSSFNCESFLPSFFSVSNENYDQHLLQQDMKDAHASYPSISAVLTQGGYRPFETVDEFGISSLQDNVVIESGDEIEIALRDALIKQAHTYEYSSHDASVFPIFPSTRRHYREIFRAPPPPAYLRTRFEGQACEKERRGRYSMQMQCWDQIELQPQHYSAGCQNDNINSSARMSFSSSPSCCSNVEDLYLSTVVASDYPIRPNNNGNNHQNYDAAYVGEGCEEMIKEYTEEVKYGSKYADMCIPTFDFGQTEMLDEILPKGMKSTYDDSYSVCLKELIDIDDSYSVCLEELIDIEDIIIDSSVHTANKNNIEALSNGDLDGWRTNLNDEILILEGKGSQEMVGANKADDIEIFMSSIMDTDQRLSVENFDSYDHKSTESSLENLNFDADIDWDDVRA